MKPPGKWDHLAGWVAFAEWEESEGDAMVKASRVLRFALFKVSPRRAICDVVGGESFTLPGGVIVVCRVELSAPVLWS